jgi:lysophospholipid acyltransferase (LPLAT)-like uncharacterized protein
MSSWDGFIIPKPFARVTVAYGVPTRVKAASPRDAVAEAPVLEALMEDATEKACG